MNKIIQPLRFHNVSTERLHYRNLARDYKVITPLVMPSTTLIPFMLYEALDLTFLAIKECKIYDYKTGVATDILSSMNFVFGFDSSSADYTYMFHPGTSTISTIKQGIHSLYVKSGYDSEYWSDLFLVGNYDTILFEFHNTKSFANLWMRPEYYKAYYRAYTFDEGEYDEYAESFKDDNNYDTYSYQRVDKLRTIMIMGDSNVVDCLNIMKMCDSVFITDEVNKRQEIKIIDVKPEPQGANYMNILVKYRVVDNHIISVDTQSISAVKTQTGTVFGTPAQGIFLGEDQLYLGDKKIKLK